MGATMAQASVLTNSDIRRVFRIIETTRHAERNRLAFVLSIYAGLRVGEIAALRFGDVATAQGDVRREIKLAASQTKGSKGRTVILSERVRREIDAHLKNRLCRYDATPLIASQRNGRFFSSVSLSMLFKEIYDLAGIRTTSQGWSKIKRRLDEAMKIPPWLLHDLRRTAATGMAKIGIAPHIVEAALNHISGAKAGVGKYQVRVKGCAYGRNC
jgi:integrase/recombinase XerD